MEWKWLTAKQVAARYGLTVQWVYHCPELKQFAVRLGKRKGLRWSIPSLEQFERERLNDEKPTGGKRTDLEAARKWQEAQRAKRFKFDIA